MLSLSMVELLQARSCPDDYSFEAAASTTSYLLIVCDGCHVAFREQKWPINVGVKSMDGYIIVTKESFSSTLEKRSLV